MLRPLHFLLLLLVISFTMAAPAPPDVNRKDLENAQFEPENLPAAAADDDLEADASSWGYGRNRGWGTGWGGGWSGGQGNGWGGRYSGWGGRGYGWGGRGWGSGYNTWG